MRFTVEGRGSMALQRPVLCEERALSLPPVAHERTPWQIGVARAVAVVAILYHLNLK